MSRLRGLYSEALTKLGYGFPQLFEPDSESGRHPTVEVGDVEESGVSHHSEPTYLCTHALQNAVLILLDALVAETIIIKRDVIM